MKKKTVVVVMAVLVLFCMVTSVFAHPQIKLFFNGQEIKSDVSPRVDGGRVLAPVRIIAERLGALINWNEKKNTIDIDFTEVQAQKTRISLLESALAPKDPHAAVATWAEGVKTRNGALQYAVMSQELREDVYSHFVELNWTTGTSSPWVLSYEVIDKGKIDGETFWYAVEFTYTDSKQSTFTARKCVTAKNYEGNWLITSVMDQLQADPVVYKNTRYGFTFSLPENWEGYTIITDGWEGRSMEGENSGRVTEKGPIISLRHPGWTAQNPRQDIPIMIFTHVQWALLQQEKFSVGAAPVGPGEIDLNSSYVFALPARYNYAFLTGYEEVEKIMEGSPLRPLKN